MVISFGSINVDFVVRCERAPDQGETIVSTGWLTNPGGKGANQAGGAQQAMPDRAAVHAFLTARGDPAGDHL